jgi:phosphomannomutase
MVSASHLPADRNGFKFFGRRQGGGFTKAHVQQLCQLASQHVNEWQDAGFLPPSSGKEAVFCSEWVDYMPVYAASLKQAILREQQQYSACLAPMDKPLTGLRIVLNAGHGSGGFFQQVLHDLGADVSASIHLEPDSSFPVGVPNPEYAPMIDVTTRVCEQSNAHLGIMLDTDADRCGFIVPRTVSADGLTCSNYEVLNRNRLIAVLAVIFAQTSPGCAVVTDSVTSEGLAKFLTETLGLQHIRYLKGYANVIAKAKEVTERGQANAELAIETSGHCAMKENGYLDDGTYTSIKVVGLLARITRESSKRSLLDLILELEELDHVKEVRLKVVDGSLETTSMMFDFCALEMERLAAKEQKSEDDVTAIWEVDEENLEGIRIRTGPSGGFFMLRKSLHDPIISLQVEASSREEARNVIIEPLLRHFRSDPQISHSLDLSVLENY